MIKTRFAPSPTGELHIGGARTALFSYLFAKNAGGEFLLRIEDTDRERYVDGSVERIIESLNWFGIKADNIENPMVQSERLNKYRDIALKLVSEGKAFVCTCSKEQLTKDREEQIKKGEAPRYGGRCRENHKSQITNHKYEEGRSVIRMKMPREGVIKIKDQIHGEVVFEAKLLDDQIILKSDGYPTYHLASVIDDNEMGITHVIRSDEWLPSTPKHLVLYEMLGFKAPEFAHLPMILGPDKKKLSKRHGATSVLEYRDEGYLPEALVNFIAFLGWNPKDEREIFSIDELSREFSLSKVNKSPAIFDVEKLKDINQIYLKTNNEKLKTLVKDFGVDDLSSGEIGLIGRGGFKTLKEMAEYLKKLRREPEYQTELLIFKKSDRERTAKGLSVVSRKLSVVSQWDSDGLQKIIENIVQDNNLTNGDVFWPIRVALSGEERSPSPVELMVALGKERSIERVNKAVTLISKISKH